MNAHASESLNLKQASLLLAQEQEHVPLHQTWLTDIKSIDAQLKDVFTSGKVLGLASRSDSGETTPLAIHLVSTYLSIPQKAEDTSRPSVFIICPPSAQTTLSVAALLDQRLEAQSVESRSLNLTAVLSRIQLLQYLSLDGLIESIGDVSASLHQSAGKGHVPAQTVLLLQGFSSTLSDTSRRSGSTQTATLATNISRSLTHLSRTFANLLVVVELDMEASGTPASVDHTRAAAFSSPAATSRRVSDENALPTAFTSQHGQAFSLIPAVPSVSNALDTGVDTLVAVHDAFGKTRAHDKQEAKKGPNRGKTLVVEVLKDRTGSKTGDWCLWVQ